MKKKKIFWFILIVLMIAIILIIFKNVIKNKKNGNNMNSQEIVDNILNLNSYRATVYVEVNSNKNKNRYILKQEYNTENGFVQEIVEPSNIKGVKITKKDNNLIIENSALNLKTVFENYNELEENSLDLISFINEYKECTNSKYEEKDGKVIMKTTSTTDNIYIKNKILYIDKENIMPTKLIIKDNNQNTTIIIEYNEIELN